MPKEIVVNVGERETRIAVIEDGKLVEVHIERAERVVGSLYKCRVSNVIQGMDAAFVDIGLDRNAFLAVGDVLLTGDESGGRATTDPIVETSPASAAISSPANLNNGRDRRGRRFGKDARPERDRRETPQPSPTLELPAEVVTAGRLGTPSPNPVEATPEEAAQTANAPDENSREEALEATLEAGEIADRNQKDGNTNAAESLPDSAAAKPGEEAQTPNALSPDALLDASNTEVTNTGEDQDALSQVEGEVPSAESSQEPPTAQENGAEAGTSETEEFATQGQDEESIRNEAADAVTQETLLSATEAVITNGDVTNGEATDADTGGNDEPDGEADFPVGSAVDIDDADSTDEGFDDDEIADAFDDDEENDEGDEDLEEEDEAEEAESGSPSREQNGSPHRPYRTKSAYPRRSMLRQQRISDVLKIGQEVLVQVIKGPRSTKGARVSTRISLPGRYLVLMPDGDNLGVSRKIEDSKERDRLKKIGDRIRVPGFGLIIRTEAEDKTEQELKADMDYLVQNWRQVQENARDMTAPALVLQDLTLLYKTIRDVFGSDVQKLVIDDPAEYEKANDLLDRISPKLKGRVHLYDGAKPIFDEYNLESEIERLTRRKVFLRSGGSLVIDETEALTVIDVNTSKNVGGNSLAETILRTNIDAAGEIARQLRLRDIGGIIVIDFIDMNNPRDKQSVVKALETALKKDRSRTKISNISPLGLVEMTRKRTGETLSGFMTDECPYCKGRGHLPSPESVSLLVERDLRRQINTAQNAKKDAFLLRCHPEVAELIIGPEGATVEEMERQVERALFVRADEDAHIEAYTITPGEIGEFEKNKLNYRRAQVVECRIMRSLLKEPNKCIGWADGYMLDLDDGSRYVGQKAKVRITDIRRSYAAGTLIPGTNKPLDE